MKCECCRRHNYENEYPNEFENDPYWIIIKTGCYLLIGFLIGFILVMTFG